MTALERPPASLSSFPVPGVEAMRDNKLHAKFTAVDDAVAQPDGAQERSSGAGGGTRRREEGAVDVNPLGWLRVGGCKASL